MGRRDGHRHRVGELTVTEAPTLLATLEELAGWLDLSPMQISVSRATSVLGVVSAVVRAEARTDWTADDVPPEVRGIVLRVAAREYRNPTNARQQSAGPFSTSGADVGGILLTDDEKAVIREAVGRPQGLWALRTSRGDYGPATVWAPTEPPAKPFPLEPG